MSYFPDLTAYRFLPDCPAALNVGWLSRDAPFDQGTVRRELIDKLRELSVEHPTNQTRGFHICEFCTNEMANQGLVAEWNGHSRRLGSAEIWVRSQSGVSYAAPDLIVHYVECHGYRPPSEFLEALEKGRWEDIG